MTQNEIIELARQAGMEVHGGKGQIRIGLDVFTGDDTTNQVVAFAKLVEDKVRQEIIEKNAPVIRKVNEHIKELQDAVKAEREACAKLCDKFNWGQAPKMIQEAIRARGEA
jgi:hypothetical protein